MTRTEFINSMNDVSFTANENLAQRKVVLSVNTEHVCINFTTGEVLDSAIDNSACMLPEVFALEWQVMYDVFTGHVSIFDAYISRKLTTNGYLPFLYRLVHFVQKGYVVDVPP